MLIFEARFYRLESNEHYSTLEIEAESMPAAFAAADAYCNGYNKAINETRKRNSKSLVIVLDSIHRVPEPMT